MSSPAQTPAPADRRWTWMFVAMAVVLLLPAVLAIPLRVSFDSNEGWNALWSTRLARGEAIYFGPGDLMANNYPPLSFHLLAWFPDPLLAGRVVAALALLATALFAGLAVGRLGGTGGLTAGLIVSFMAAHHPGYVGMNDPQWLGHALMMGALLLLVRGGTGWGMLAVIAALLLAAGLVKHLLLPLPVAITWWIWREERAALGRWLVLAGGGLALALGWLRWRHGAEAFEQILFSPRGYSLAVGLRSIGRWGAVAAPLLWLGVAGTSGMPARYRGLFRAYLLLAAALAAAVIGGEGVDRNAYFDTVLAAGLGAGFVPARPARQRAWLLAAVLVTLLVVLPARWQRLGERQAREPDWREDCAWLARQEGPVIVHDLALAHWSGRQAIADSYFFSSRLRGDVARFGAQARRAPVWVLPPLGSWPLFTGDENARLLADYRLARSSSNGRFLARAVSAELPGEPPPAATP